MDKSEILKKMAELCLAIYGAKEKIPANVASYMLSSPLKGLGLITQRREMPTDNQEVAEILNKVHMDDLDFDQPANSAERGAWEIALYRQG